MRWKLSPWPRVNHRTVLGELLAHALGKGLRCCLAPLIDPHGALVLGDVGHQRGDLDFGEAHDVFDMIGLVGFP